MISNLSCECFKKDLSKIINECELPPVVAYYIMKDSLHELQQICQDVLNYELNNSQEQKKQIIVNQQGNIFEKKADQQES